MILVFGTLYDEMTELMCSRLKQLNYEYVLIETENIMSYKFTWTARQCKQGELFLHKGNQKIKTNEVSGIYTRFAEVKAGKRVKGFTKKESSVFKSESYVSCLSFIDNFPGKVINRLMNSLSNESKTFQQLQISKMGFNVPKTFITNDPKNILRFYESCNRKIIFKSLSNIRSIVSEFSPVHFSRLNLIKNCPVQFQELIEGLEIRVHIVGEKVFATGIESDAIDYRYAGKYKKEVKFFPYTLPTEIAKTCILLSKSFGLEVAGIDLKLTDDGKFFCFEVNPSPAFIVYERMTGQPISREVAFLMKGKQK